jgi:signal peptidase II
MQDIKQINIMKMFHRLGLSVTIIITCAVSDQVTKMIAQYHLQGHASQTFLNGFFAFVYAENTGTMLGIGSDLPQNMRFVLFVLLVGFFLLAVFLAVLLKPLKHLTVISISLVVGGGVSNLIDRVLYDGAVIDFMLFKMGSFESGIFNGADLEIISGICMMCFIFMRKREDSV